jgi:type III secretion protein V
VALCVAGGTALSVVDQNASIGAAFQRWSVIGIGIGLLAQLSAFTIALATGVILTRSQHDSRSATTNASIRVWSLVTREAVQGARRSYLEGIVEQARAAFVNASGLPLPACHFEVDPRMDEGHCVLAVRGIPAQRVQLPGERDEPAAFRAALRECLWRHSTEFLGVAETQELTEQLDASGSATLGQVVPRLISLNTLSEILRRLVAERVSIRDLKAVLEALATAANGESDVGALVEVVRSQLKRALSHQHAAATGEIQALLIEPALEGILRGSIVRNKGNSALSLSPAAARDFVSAVTRSLAAARTSAPEQTLVVLASPDVRRFVRHLLETDHPNLPVLSPAELLPQTAIHPVGTVTLQGL